jgi:hypothetical protein
LIKLKQLLKIQTAETRTKPRAAPEPRIRGMNICGKEQMTIEWKILTVTLVPKSI